MRVRYHHSSDTAHLDWRTVSKYPSICHLGCGGQLLVRITRHSTNGIHSPRGALESAKARHARDDRRRHPYPHSNAETDLVIQQWPGPSTVPGASLGWSSVSTHDFLGGVIPYLLIYTT